MVWSFSRLSLYDDCPYAWYLKYIEKEPGEKNFYADNGKLMHEIFDMIAKGEMSLDDAPDYYIAKFEEIDSEIKDSIKNNVFSKCLTYLADFEGLKTLDYSVLKSEMKLRFHWDGYEFIGFVDLLLKDNKTGEIILVDHKSSDHFMKKDGVTPLKNSLHSFLSYKNQMYLYAYGLQVQEGIKVSKICWHHFKDDGTLTVIPYEEEEIEKVKEWAFDIIHRIEQDEEFEAKKSFMRCKSICDYRNECPYVEEY